MGKLRVGINGFGRIGRILCRAGFDRVEIVGVNDLCTAEASAHLLKYDSTHGVWDKKVGADETHLMVNDQKINYSSHRDPAEIPWKDWGVDVVLECTGIFKTKEDILKHKTAGAKKIIVSAPSPAADITVVYGINQELYNPKEHQILSNASCTTNCLAPIAKVLHDEFGIEYGLMTTIHSYTNDQKMLDTPHKDLRRARAGALSMIPTTTGAAKAVGQVLPELVGRIDGLAIRVPTPNVSLVDLVVTTKNKVSAELANEALKEAAEGRLKGILQYETAPLVSTDFNGNTHSSIVDSLNTMSVGDHMVKVFSWYDNEVGFSNRMIDLALYVSEKGL